MTARRQLTLAAVTAGLALAVACSHPQDTTGSPFPSRPATVDVSRTPPCELLTKSQTTALGLREGNAGTANVNGRRSPACTWLGAGAVDYNAQFIAVDAQLAVTEPGAQVVLVDGFGAAQSVPGQTFGGTSFCQVTVDVADQQAIRVQARTRPGEPPIGIEEQCRRANEFASMVMTTVVATASR